MTWDLFAMIFIIAAAPPATAFPILYWVGARWWRSVEGQAVMIATTGLALLLDFALLSRVVDLSDAFLDPLRVVIFGLISAGTYWMLAALIRHQYLFRGTPRE